VLKNISVEVVSISQPDGTVIGLTQVLDENENELMLEDKRYGSEMNFAEKLSRRFLRNDRFELVKQVDNDTKTGTIYYMIDKKR
jgi:hypothetical protein